MNILWEYSIYLSYNQDTVSKSIDSIDISDINVSGMINEHI